MELQWLGVDTTNGPAEMFRELARRGESITLDQTQLAAFAAYFQIWEDTMLDKLFYELELPPLDFENGEQFSDWLNRHFVRKVEVPEEDRLYVDTVMSDVASLVEGGQFGDAQDLILSFARQGLSYGD